MKMTQKDMVLDHLKKYRRITNLEAYRDMGIRRLAAVVSDLRSEGHMIRTENTTRPNRYGRRTTFATYILEE